MTTTHRPGSRHRRPSRLAVAVLVPALAGLAGCGGADPRSIEPASPTTTTTPAAPPGRRSTDPVAQPVGIDIPAIDVSADMIEVGLDPSGAMAVPDFGLAGWYGPGPRPGAPGPAVVVAHVDSQAGPDVFFRLRELAAGAEIVVRGEDGTARRFAVTHQEQVPKDQLPTERIWNETDVPVLRLVTCGGSFDASTGHYRDNVIVYATPLAA